MNCVPPGLTSEVLREFVARQMREVEVAAREIGVPFSELILVSDCADGERWVEARHLPSGVSVRVPDPVVYREDETGMSAEWGNTRAEAFRRLKTAMRGNARGGDGDEDRSL